MAQGTLRNTKSGRNLPQCPSVAHKAWLDVVLSPSDLTPPFFPCSSPGTSHHGLFTVPQSCQTHTSLPQALCTCRSHALNTILSGTCLTRSLATSKSLFKREDFPGHLMSTVPPLSQPIHTPLCPQLSLFMVLLTIHILRILLSSLSPISPS